VFSATLSIKFVKAMGNLYEMYIILNWCHLNNIHTLQ